MGFAAGAWLTRANGLSLLRLLAAPGLVAALCAGRAGVAAALLVGIFASDFADGWVARRYGEVSPLGGLLDHGSDALVAATGLAALASLGVVPWPLPVLVAAAFLQYVFDSRALVGRSLRASRLGRWNGIAYLVLLAVPVFRDALALGLPSDAWVFAAGWALVTTSVASMFGRWRAWREAQASAS